jgi:hypothetical protein
VRVFLSELAARAASPSREIAPPVFTGSRVSACGLARDDAEFAPAPYTATA